MTIAAPCIRLEDRTLIYNPQTAEVVIKKTSHIRTDSDEYWTLFLEDPTKETNDCWDVFIDRNGEKIWAQAPDEGPKEGYFIARLNLETLGMKDKFFRKYGKLQSVCIPKPNGS
ncbi:hypothetical protein F4805DRAFT_137511 [Annulohypoxylon moriforme]|nr:hypothetical protein F4805DRAFT_137511 [Annulohypoxylon moriforme]